MPRDEAPSKTTPPLQQPTRAPRPSQRPTPKPSNAERTQAALAEPRRATWWAAAVYALATLTLAYPALTGGFLVNPRSDQYFAGYAFREFAAQWLKSGHGFPQWNPYLFGGLPYIAAMHGDIFYPTFLLRMVLPTDIAMTSSFVIHLFLAGLFTYWFLRVCGVGFYSALIGGLAYMLSGPIAGYASPGHDGKLYVSALLPAALGILVRGVRDGRAWAWGAFAIVIALAALSPHPQMLQYLLILSGAFALYVAFARDASGSVLPRRIAITRLGAALGAVVLGLLASAVQYGPALIEYKSWSPRAPGHDWATATSYSMPPEEVLNAVLPQFSGILDAYWGRNAVHYHSEYVGVVVLVLAAAGAIWSTERRSFRWFWIGTLIVSLLWALGGYTPFFQLIFSVVPYTKYLRAPSMMMVVSMFSVAVLASLGVERLLQGNWSRKLFVWPAAIALLCVLLASGMAVGIADSVGEWMARTYQGVQASDIGQRARDNQGAVVLGALRSIVFLALLSGALWLMLAERISRRAAAFALAAIVMVDLWSIERKYWIFSPRANVLYASDPAIEAIRSSREPARVLAADLLQSGVPHDPAFRDGLMTYRIRLVTGYHGNELGRYDQLLANSNNGLRPELWRHENVQYLYTTLPDSLIPVAQAQLRWPGTPTKVVGPVRNAAGSTIYLYRLPGNNPAAWVASAMVKGSDDEALATVLDSRFDATRAAILDTGAKIDVAPVTAVPAPSGVQARVTRYDPGAIDVQLDKPAAAGSALVVSENYFPGWEGTSNGRKSTVARANFNLIGVELPQGARSVQLRFVDRAYEAAKPITLLALALAIIATIVGVLYDRRRQPALAT